MGVGSAEMAILFVIAVLFWGGLAALVFLVVKIARNTTPPALPANGSLYPCPDCGRHVSRLAVTCPQCGRPLAAG
jgi:hypothetical protein